MKRINEFTWKHVWKIIVAYVLLAAVTLVTTGCPNQNGIAALVTILGSASATVADIQGNPTLAAKLRTDTAAASSAVLNWKSGTPSQNAIQALQLVQDDLSLFPIDSKYVMLVDLAIGTAQSIIVLLQPDNTGPQAAHAPMRQVSIADPPKTADQFKTRWNAIVASKPDLAQAKLQ